MAEFSAYGKCAFRGFIRVWRFLPPRTAGKSRRYEIGFPQTAAKLEMCVMKLLFEDLPEEIETLIRILSFTAPISAYLVARP
jgi:hypothetical protein